MVTKRQLDNLKKIFNRNNYDLSLLSKQEKEEFLDLLNRYQGLNSYFDDDFSMDKFHCLANKAKYDWRGNGNKKLEDFIK